MPGPVSMSYQLKQLITGYAARIESEEAKKKASSGKSPLIREIQRRIAQNMDSRIIIEGEAGLGKSYASLRLGEIIDLRFVNDPEGAVENQVLFSASEFLNAVQTLPPFSVLIYDEPGQSFHHREFMSQANIILSKTMIGFRLKRFITFLNIPGLGMIDKDAKTLVSFLINITGHGQGEIYKQIPAKFSGDTWFKTIVDKQHFELPSVKLRHAYEKKKQRVQDKLYTEYGKALSDSNEPKLTTRDLIETVRKDPEKFKRDGEFNVTVLQGELDIGRERARAIKAKLLSKRE